MLTFNIHGALGHDGYDLDRVAEEIAAWKADVVLLQEVDRHRDRTDLDDQPVALAAALDMFASYGANVVRPAVTEGGKEQEYGNLTLSRYPVLESENVRLPNRPGLERPRAAAHHGRRRRGVGRRLQHPSPAHLGRRPTRPGARDQGRAAHP